MMSVCAQNGQGEEEHASDEVLAPVRDNYKQKPASKVVRVLTVLAYLLSVSLAAILLSVYYVCVWKSPELPPHNNTLEINASRIYDLSEYSQTVADLTFIGGINTSIDVVDSHSARTVTPTMDVTNTSGVEIFSSVSNLIPTSVPDYKQSDSNITLHDIGTLNDTDNSIT